MLPLWEPGHTNAVAGALRRWREPRVVGEADRVETSAEVRARGVAPEEGASDPRVAGQWNTAGSRNKRGAEPDAAQRASATRRNRTAPGRRPLRGAVEALPLLDTRAFRLRVA